MSSATRVITFLKICMSQPIYKKKLVKVQLKRKIIYEIVVNGNSLN